MNHAVNFIKGRKPIKTQIFLYDCDTNKNESDENNIVVMRMPLYDQHKVMNKGIENALELMDIDISKFYEEHIYQKDYGQSETKKDFQKMKLCDYICNLEIDAQRKILSNLRPIIDRIVERVARE